MLLPKPPAQGDACRSSQGLAALHSLLGVKLGFVIESNSFKFLNKHASTLCIVYFQMLGNFALNLDYLQRIPPGTSWCTHLVPEYQPCLTLQNGFLSLLLNIFQVMFEMKMCVAFLSLQ